MFCYQGFVLAAWRVSQFLPQFIILNLEFKQQESDTEQAPSPDVFKVSEPGQWSAQGRAGDNLPPCLPCLSSQRESDKCLIRG